MLQCGRARRVLVRLVLVKAESSPHRGRPHL